MEGRGRQLFIVLIIGGAGFWLYSHREKPASTAPAASAASSGAVSSGPGCVRAADSANQALHDAAMLLLRPPVDPGSWSSAEMSVSSAISAAESSCSGAGSDTDRKVADEVKGALSLMRSSLANYSNAARGASGAAEASSRQGEIEARLERAHGMH